MTGARRRYARRAATLVALPALLAACHSGSGAMPAVRTPTVSNVAAQPATVPEAASAPISPDPRDTAVRRLTAIAAHLPAGAISVAALNVRTGASLRWGERRGMWTGSVYKLLVLETLLVERQRSGGSFSGDELSGITAMIERSDNQAGYRMFLDAGGGAGLAAGARRLGLRHTRIGVADPALTTMSGPDGIVLLRHLVSGGPLTARSKQFVLSLMREVESDQRWGVGVVADSHTRFANKNGWMAVDATNGRGEDDGGRWLVNSLGIVRVDGQRVLMAIFTKHDPDCDSGIALVERLARVIVPAVVSG